MEPSSASSSSRKRYERILNPTQPLQREDVIWMLDYIKKKVADKHSELNELSQPRLLQNFHSFAEAAMSLLQPAHGSAADAQRIRHSLKEASFGLNP